MAETEYDVAESDSQTSFVGRSVERLEDEVILAGQTTYLDDIELPDMLHATVVRSPYGHARIRDVETSSALEMDGVADVITGSEASQVASDFGQRRSGFSMPDHPPLVREKARMFGDGIAAVAAETKYRADDAAERVEVEFERLPAVTTIEQALSPESDDEIIHPKLDSEEDDVDGNTWGEYSMEIGDVETAFGQADHTVSHEIVTSRPTAVPMEPHGAIADYSSSEDELTVYTTTQEAHQIRRDLAVTLDLPYNRITIEQPSHMGGGFGHKLGLKAHEVIASVLSVRTGRPVKLTLTRIEEFQATRSRQPQRHELELALTDEGEFLGIRGDITAQGGAYAAETKPGMVIAAMFVPTPYRFETVSLEGRCVFTNTIPAGPYRGFGLTQATTARETLIDKAATELGIDRWEIRRRNLISDEECPTDHPVGYYLDSCGVDECLESVEASLETGLLDESTPADRIRGMGVATAMHVSSMQRPSYDADNSAITLQLYEDGSISVKSDQCTMGTGIQTTLAQVIADELSVDYRDLTFKFGDSEETPYGLGSWGSRGITIAGNAAYKAAGSLRDRLLRIASFQLGEPTERLSLVDGRVVVEGKSGSSVSIRDLAYDAHYNGSHIPDDMTPGPVTVTEAFDSPAPGPLDDKGRHDTSTTYPTNAHAAIVEIDANTGAVDILDYAIGDDAGRIINPMIVEGQVQGGTVQGLGMALGEHLEYNSNGQLENGTMEEYSLPLIAETPMLTKVFHAETEAERSPIKAKGVGESGAITAPVTVLNAVTDALRRAGCEDPSPDLPVTPEKVHGKLQE